MQPKLLEVRGLHRAFRTGPLGRRVVEVLAGVDLDLEAGERALVAGPNGSGKSTLLRILASVEAADAGQALLAGVPIDSSVARRRIGYAPDGCPFPKELSARTMIRVVGELAGLGRREAREAGERQLARVGLAEAAGRKLGHFSKGMQRRFTLAQAMLGEPELLLLDEPTDGLDAEGFGVLAALLDEARARGAGVLFASHVAILDCDRVHLLWSGRVAREVGPDELSEEAGGLLAAYARLAAGGPT